MKFSLKILIKTGSFMRVSIVADFSTFIALFKNCGSPGHFPMNRECTLFNEFVEQINEGFVNVGQGKFQNLARNIVLSKPFGFIHFTDSTSDMEIIYFLKLEMQNTYIHCVIASQKWVCRLIYIVSKILSHRTKVIIHSI